MQGDADSDDDDDGKRVVRSHKDKRWDQMTETIAKMKNSMKNNDWNAVTDDFAALHKLLEKAKQIVAKEGLPTFYFKALLTLDVSAFRADASRTTALHRAALSSSEHAAGVCRILVAAGAESLLNDLRDE